MPFFVIGGIACWKQWQAPSASRIESTLTAVRAMSWPEFSRAIEDAYRAQGYRVSDVAEGAANFEISKDGRTALVHCKRWKVARTGVEPLSELHASKEARNAHECIYVAAARSAPTRAPLRRSTRSSWSTRRSSRSCCRRRAGRRKSQGSGTR
jgi:restriction system protein